MPENEQKTGCLDILAEGVVFLIVLGAVLCSYLLVYDLHSKGVIDWKRDYLPAKRE